jgi:predicted  nucleic acid-binding Zn-ribbon protein
MDMDSVQIRCTRCKGAFRDRARRLQNGFSRQCPSCEVVLFFDEDSHDANIKRSMRTARRVRAALREAEAEGLSKTKATGASRRSSGRRRISARDDEATAE